MLHFIINYYSGERYFSVLGLTEVHLKDLTIKKISNKLSHQFINNSIEFILCGPFLEQRQHPCTPSWVVYYIVGLVPIL